MASGTIRRLYFRERAKGHEARSAYRNAIVRAKWDALEDLGLVRLSFPYDDHADLSFLDQGHYQDSREGRALAKMLRERAERDGCYGIVGEYRLDPESGEWEQGDSVWGFIGDADISEEFGSGLNCYGPDIMDRTLDKFKAAWKDRVRDACPACHGTGRAHP